MDQQIQILLGGSVLGLGNFATPEDATAFLDLAVDSRISRVDSAALYPTNSPGKSEQLLGDYLASVPSRKLMVDTKILVKDYSGKGSLTPAAIAESVSGSLSRLRTKIGVLYCHTPDPDTPIAATAAALHEHYKENHFEKLGLSNFLPEQIEEFMSICEEKGYVKPSCFQGQYNALCRNPENTLFPLLRKYDMSYIAYSPVAGGFLTGIFTEGMHVAGTRFEEGNHRGSGYRKMYDKAVMHAAIEKLQHACKQHGVSLIEAALRWMLYHSALQANDGFILGASRIEQFQENMESLSKGPLVKELVELFEEAWKSVEAEAPL